MGSSTKGRSGHRADPHAARRAIPSPGPPTEPSITPRTESSSIPPATRHRHAPTSRSIQDLIFGLANRQHGVVTRAQLLVAGVSERTVERRLKANRLRPLHRGVYLVGPHLPSRASEMAAVLACGAGAAVSHRSAAILWDLLPRSNETKPVDVTVQARGIGRRRGIRRHGVVRLEADEVAFVDGIPATTPGRTILDLATCVRARELEQALAQAERQQLTSAAELIALMARHAGRPGTRALRELLQQDSHPALTRSEAEERFLALIRKARLSQPETNVVVGGHEVDFLWRSEGVVVEVDGYAFHSSKRRFESDRRRDAQLAAGGVQMIRVTWRQIIAEPHATVVRLAQTLVRASLR